MSGILAAHGDAAPEARRLARAHSSNPDIAALQPAAAAASPSPAVGSPPDVSGGPPNVASAADAAASAIAAAVDAVAGGGTPARPAADDGAASHPSEAAEMEGGPEAVLPAAGSAALSAPRPAGMSAEEQSRRVLLCRERHEFLCSVEESPGMPWPRAKFQVCPWTCTEDHMQTA